MKTITLCGSSRFDKMYDTCATLLTGLAVVVLTHGYHDPEVPAMPEDPTKRRPIYDLMMLDKIQKSDAILIVDVDGEQLSQAPGSGYYGEETAREILWASMNGVPIAFLSDSAGAVGGDVAKAMSDVVDQLIEGSLLTMHVDPAIDLLNHVMGRQRVVEAKTDSTRDLMHAVLSHIADVPEAMMGDEATIAANQVLDAVGLVVMPQEQRAPYLAIVDQASSLAKESAVS